MQPLIIPTEGEAIQYQQGQIQVPDRPIIPYIEGDGIGVDITPAMRTVVDAAVAKAYASKRKIAWMEVYAGEKATKKYGENHWLPKQTIDAIKQYHVGIKGPLTTPVGGGIRSLNVAIRQALDLYVCLRPVEYFPGTPSPLKEPEKTKMTIFRENSEDIYAGIEFAAKSTTTNELIKLLQTEYNVDKIRYPQSTGLGIKVVSEQGSKRLIRKAIAYALQQPGQRSVTLVHKGNIMKYTEGSFRDWGYELAREEFGAKELDGGPWHIIERPGENNHVIIKDVIADAFFQHILLRPEDYDVIATLNLNGDYLSDALAAQVGGIGIAPGANIGENCAVFEATHGTAPRYAGQDKVNPSSMILSAVMLLKHLNWVEAADLIVYGIQKAIKNQQVTYDFARFFQGVSPLSCSAYAQAIVHHFMRK